MLDHSYDPWNRSRSLDHNVFMRFKTKPWCVLCSLVSYSQIIFNVGMHYIWSKMSLTPLLLTAWRDDNSLNFFDFDFQFPRTGIFKFVWRVEDSRVGNSLSEIQLAEVVTCMTIHSVWLSVVGQYNYLFIRISIKDLLFSKTPASDILILWFPIGDEGAS